jgi:hypothetical protein
MLGTGHDDWLRLGLSGTRANLSQTRIHLHECLATHATRRPLREHETIPDLMASRTGTFD